MEQTLHVYQSCDLDLDFKCVLSSPHSHGDSCRIGLLGLFCGDEKTKEYDIGTPSDNLKKCMVHVDAGDNFCIKIRKTDMSSFRGKNFYVKIVLDGVVYDHFMMYEGVFQVTSLGWQSPSGMVKPYKWCTSNNMGEYSAYTSFRVILLARPAQTSGALETCLRAQNTEWKEVSELQFIRSMCRRSLLPRLLNRRLTSRDALHVLDSEGKARGRRSMLTSITGSWTISHLRSNDTAHRIRNTWGPFFSPQYFSIILRKGEG
ncbi:hypothetical protein K474DRAFT_1446475 [Panus rudis PR-1116 ss-1]|nr:hypothetical protein K474DRAFT_1446475 [Panus rudis PR-1116 ss-1]